MRPLHSVHTYLSTNAPAPARHGSPVGRVEKLVEMQTEPVRVVLADDDADIRRLLSTLLTQDGIDVVGEADDGEKAIEVVGELQPSFVVMDLMMPTLGGAEATREIAARWPGVIIVGLTAGDSSARDCLLEAGSHIVFDKIDVIEMLDWFTQQWQCRRRDNSIPSRLKTKREADPDAT